MRVKDLIEKLIEIERDYGNLPINRFNEDIDLEIEDDKIIIHPDYSYTGRIR